MISPVETWLDQKLTPKIAFHLSWLLLELRLLSILRCFAAVGTVVMHLNVPCRVSADKRYVKHDKA